MKLMVVGSDKVYAIENFYVKYIRETGMQVQAFNAQSFFYDYYQKSFLNKIIFKAGLSGILKRINVLFKESVEQFKPDVIWVFKGMEIFPESLKWAKTKGIRLVNYNPDNPFLFTGKGSGNENVSRSIALYDLHFTYNLEIQKKILEVYHCKTAYLPFAFDLPETLYQECVAQEELVKACFLGNPDKKRAAFLISLAKKGVKMDLYGNDWHKFVQHENLNPCDPVYGDELWKVLRKYRVQLNLMRIHNEDSHNMRTFEVAGVGGIQVAPDTSEHRMFFKDGEEIFLYKNAEDCSTQIKKLLSLSEESAKAIRNKCRLISLQNKYTYKDRALFALEEIKKI